MLDVRSSSGSPVGTGTSPSSDVMTLARSLVDMVRGLPDGLAMVQAAIGSVAGQAPGFARQLETAIETFLTPVERGQFAARATAPASEGGAATPAEQTVTVRRGDTLSGIAAANNTTWQALARANGLADPDRLAVGQRLVVPGGTAAPPAAAPGAAAPVAATGGVSAAGLSALYGREAQAGVSDRLHWPGGASGVTLGPGYDLKGRTPASVVSDLTAIGVDRASAERVAQGAGLSGAAARDFAATKRGVVRLSGTQETALLGRTIAPYAEAVRAQVRVPVSQNQFDALVSFAYNIGTGGFAGSTTLRLLNSGDAAGAADAMRLWNKSDGQVVQGLVNRREAEVRQFNTPGPALAAPRAAAPASAAARAEPAAGDFVAQLMASGDARARADYAAGQRVVVAIRSDTNVRDNPNGRYDDRIAVVWRGADGQPQIRAFDGNTEPSGQYRFDGAKGSRGYGNDMNGDGRLELGRLVEGSYRYTRQSGSFLGNTFFRPDATTPVVRDTNGDGRFTAADRNGLDRSGAGRSILIHQGGASNSWSAGCQTLASADFNAFVAALGGQRSFSYVLVNASN